MLGSLRAMTALGSDEYLNNNGHNKKKGVTDKGTYKYSFPVYIQYLDTQWYSIVA